MAYKGGTSVVTCGKGGFTGANNVDDIPPHMMIAPTRNLIFERNGRRKRGGTALVNAEAYTGTPVILGLSHVKFIGGEDIILVATDDGELYSGTSILTTLTAATGKITSNTANVSINDTVTIDGKVYKFVAAPSAEGDVLIGADAAETLDNLKLAINRTDPEDNDGVKYKVAAAHPTVEATGNTNTEQTVAALTPGTAGNSITLAKSAVSYTLSGDTLSGGVDATMLGTTKPYSMVMGENKVFIADGINIPRVWTGTGFPDEIDEPADDFSTNPVIQFLLHKRGLSLRMCALTRNTLFLSKTYVADGDMECFKTEAQSLYLDTGDSIGLVGMAEMGDEVIVFSRKRAWRLDDSDPDPVNWGFVAVQWTGGVASWRLLIKTPNDLLAMADDGEVYSVTAVSAYGDYKAASLTAPSWIHDWVRDNLDLGEIESFHGVYDPTLKAVMFFVVRNGGSTCDAALLYYPDRDPSEAWMLHDNEAAASGYQASVSAVVPLTSGSYSVYTGDYAGKIWKLNQPIRSDNGAGFYGGFKTPPDAAGDNRITKLFNTGRVTLESMGDYQLKIRVWVDDVLLPTLRTLDLAGLGASLDDFMLDEDYLSLSSAIDASFRIGKSGKRLQYEFYNDGAGEDFFISSYSTDGKALGRLEAVTSE